MICPQCEAAGERSRVFPGEITITDEKVAAALGRGRQLTSRTIRTSSQKPFHAPTGTTGGRANCAAKPSSRTWRTDNG